MERKKRGRNETKEWREVAKNEGEQRMDR